MAATIPVAPRPIADAPELLAVYGTLQRHEPAWPLLQPLVTGEPESITLPGTLYDTGKGYPALLLDDGPGVPAQLFALRAPATALPVLDEYEGPEYERAVLGPHGAARCCSRTRFWVYTWIASTVGMTPLPAGWR